MPASHLTDLLYQHPDACHPSLNFDVSFNDAKKKIELHTLYVSSEARWQGIASRFLSVLTDLADEHGYKIELEVGGGQEDNTIEDLPLFYSKRGFVWSDGFMERLPKLRASPVRRPKP
jgi:GNAT superfamily N-acetyltransferase